MPDRKPIGPTWKPKSKDVIIITNVSNENLALKLPTGRFRLDAGRSQMVAASLLDLPAIKELVEAGKITWARP
jgi:hypothetical protein